MATEDEAIEALRRGEIDGLTGLVAMHQLKALRTAYGILGNRAAAEDVVADAFLRVFDRIGTFGPGRSFEPWFYRIVVNLALDDRRRARLAEQVSAAVPDAVVPWDLDGLEQRVVLAGLIGTIPIEERAVLVLRYYLDLDEASIATVVGCPVGTVKSRLHRARLRLRVRLDDPQDGWSPATSKGA
jgi:RNA polymerase sigma-70 factor (ECF subfamily)